MPFAAKPFTAQPFAATFLPLGTLPLTAGHLHKLTSSKNRTLEAKPLAATTCSDYSQRNRPLAAKPWFSFECPILAESVLFFCK